MKKVLTLLLVLFPSFAEAGWFWQNNTPTAKGNHFSQSFYEVKKIMPEKIYYDHRQTLYCNADFTQFKRIKLPKGFKLPDLRKVDFYVYDITAEELRQKAERMEWEHIVPAQNFGKIFPEWVKGHKNCVSTKGKKFKGRKCAEQENESFRYMYTDMYNLYPSIGAVNYLRANFNFTQFAAKDEVENTFGSCNLKISKNKVEPRDEIKGLIARTYLYMQSAYPRYSIGSPMEAVLKAWNKKYPVSRWECVRAYRIEHLQGNANKIVKDKCLKKGWYVKGLKND